MASLITAGGADEVRAALAEFTVEGVREALGPVGRSALDRGDLAGVELALPAREQIAALVRLFLLGQAVPSAAAGLPAAAAPLLVVDGDEVRARFEVRPYAEDGGPDWWVVSDFGSDVRPGPLASDHVLGLGAASLSLAQAAIREPVGRALDLGTGCGVQALHLSRRARAVVATDLSGRALTLAATTAALSGVRWDLRAGSLLEPVAGEQFDQIVANPPFVVSPGHSGASGGYDYRDSGLAGDGVSAALARDIPARLAPGGTASLLANWVVTAEQPWEERVGGWLAGSGCDAWVWQREVAEPGEYVALWLRDAGEQPGTPRWAERYDAWRSWFDRAGVLAVGMGLVTLWRDSAGGPASERPDSAGGPTTPRRDSAGAPTVVCEDVRQAVEAPVGAHLPAWIARQRWLRQHDDAAVLAARLRAADGVVRTREDLRGAAGWEPARVTLRQSYGLRWELEADEAIAALVGGCDGAAPVATQLAVLAATLGAGVDDVAAAALPVLRDLIGRGFLEPIDSRPPAPAPRLAAPARAEVGR